MKALFNYAAPALLGVAAFYYMILPALTDAMSRLDAVANAL